MSDELITFVRARLEAEAASLEGYDGSYNDVDGCWGRHLDPDEERADIAAKRRILDEIVPDANAFDLSLDLERRWTKRDETAEPFLGDQLVKLLALRWSWHDDYREEWAP